jgi:hypothetical protein
VGAFPSDAAFEHAWALHRDWDRAAGARKASYSRWQRLALVLSMLGAILGAVASLATGKEGHPSEIFTVLTGVVVAVAAYVGQQVIGSSGDREWYRARGIAESLKSQCMLFATGTPPYDGPDRSVVLMQVSGEITTRGKDLQPPPAPREERRKDIPSGLPWTVDVYVKERAQQQIDWYMEHALRAGARVRACRAVTIATGLTGVICATIGPQLKLPPLGGLVSLMAALGAFVAAYLYAGRYAFLETSYVAAAHQLEALVAGWRSSGNGEGDLQARAAFIDACESALMAENGAWMATYVEGLETDTEPPAIRATNVAQGQPGRPWPAPPAAHHHG